MFKSKNQFNIIYLCLIAFLGLLFIFNTHQIMAMNNYNLTDSNSINNKINELYLERKNLATKISYLLIYDVDVTKFQQQLYNLVQIIQNLYQRLSIVNTLKDINNQIWKFSYERNQIAIKILSCSFSHQNETIEELNYNHQKIVQKINNLRQKYINLQYKLNEFH
ncbi:MAG: SVM family protein [Lettuce witches'-broom phytoplasma]